MSQTPQSGQVATVKAKPNIYTVMVLIAILALGAGVGFCLNTLMGPAPNGYELKFGQLFGPIEPPAGVEAQDAGKAAGGGSGGH